MNERMYGLTETEKRYYRSIVDLIDSHNTQWTFSDVSFDTIFKVYRAVRRDHPEFFWFSHQCNGTRSVRGTQVTLTFKPRLEDTLAQIPGMRRRLDTTAEGLIRSARRASSDLYGQVLYLHDYLVEHTDYLLNAPHCYDAYGCLVLHRAVCDGYASAFQLLMQKLGVECGRVVGRSTSRATGEGSHAWNYIRLSDGYYFVDVTWDDPVINGGTVRDNLSHDFFCLDLSEIRLTHSFEPDQFIPGTCGTKYDYYRYRGWYLDRYSYPAVRAIAANQLRHSGAFFIKFRSRSDVTEAKRDLLEGQKVFSIPGIAHSISSGVSASGLVLQVKNK